MSNKAFIREVARRKLITYREAEIILEAIIATIQDELKTDAAKCNVPGLGTFRLALVRERVYQAPGVDSLTTVPGHYTIKFKAAKELL